MKYTTQFLILVATVMTSALTYAAPSLQKINVNLQHIQYDEATMMVEMSGLLPHKCAAMPHPSLTATAETAENHTLILGVRAYSFNDICALQMGGDYRLAFDIRSLKFELERMNLDPNAEYKIVSSNKEFAITINFKDVPFTLPYASDSLIGEIRFSESQNQFLLVTAEKVFQMNSPIIELEKYAGKRLELQGHVLKQRIMRAPFATSREELASLLVTGINTTSY